MKFREAKECFEVRLYQWAQSELVAEGGRSFSAFASCNGFPMKVGLFFETLSAQERLLFGSALLQRRHQEAVAILGEASAPEYVDILRRFDRWTTLSIPHSDKLLATTLEGEFPTQMASRRCLKKAMKDHYLRAFGGDQLPHDPLEPKAEGIRVRSKCRGWVVVTTFEFGRWQPEITYEHDIWTGQWITKESPPVLFANCIGFRLNYGIELGVGSGWDRLREDQVNPACVEIVEHCRRMFVRFPVLLEGLELESLTP